jgi:hypothetical protein
MEQSRDFGLIRAEVARSSVPFYWAGDIVEPPLPSAEHQFALHGSIDTFCGADSLLRCLDFSMRQSRFTYLPPFLFAPSRVVNKQASVY